MDNNLKLPWSVDLQWGHILNCDGEITAELEFYHSANKEQSQWLAKLLVDAVNLQAFEVKTDPILDQILKQTDDEILDSLVGEGSCQNQKPLSLDEAPLSIA
jgi:hypothetical protein